MSVFFAIVLLYTIFRTIRGNYRTLRSINELLYLQKTIKNIRIKNLDIKFFILIPVLREQAIIRTTFKIFSKIKGVYELVFITTEKENVEDKDLRNKLLRVREKLFKSKKLSEFLENSSGILPKNTSEFLYKKVLQSDYSREDKLNKIVKAFDDKKSTKEILEQLISKTKTRNVRIIHYPKTKGVMAHQLNYACRVIQKEIKEENTYILIYNADSVVSEDLILDLRRYISKHRNANVIQQSSIFLDNFKNISTGLSKYFLQAIALLQTRWTLAHELPRVLNQFRSSFRRIFEGAHIVGHGLCIKLKTLKKANYFPVIYINEDLPLGYILRLSDEIIHPFFVLENAESPGTVSAMFNQYRTWFYGVISYPIYMYHAFQNKKFNKFSVLTWGLRYVIRGVLWLLLSATWIFLFLYPLFTGNPFLLFLVLVAFILYAPVNFFLIQVLLNKYKGRILKNKRFDLKIPLATYIAAFPAYLTHSIGPILAVFEIVKSSFSRKGIYKAKTER